MKKPNRASPAFRRAITLLAIALALTTLPTARAGLTLDLQVVRYNYQENYYYYFAPYLATNADAPQLPFGSYRIASPFFPTNGYHLGYTFSTNGFNFFDGSGNGYGDFNSCMDAMTNGLWTLFATNATTTNLYRFVVTSTIASNALPATLITFPTNTATGITNQPTFTWTGPPNFGLLGIQVHDPDYNFFESTNPAPNATSWFGPVLPNGTNKFYVDYRSNLTAQIVATTPTNSAGQAIASWTSTSQMASTYEVEFTVGLPGAPSSGHTNVAWYAFEDNTVFTADLSGNGNGIGSAASFGGGGVYPTNSAAAGSIAGFFEDNGGAGAGWLQPPAGLLAPLARSFSISVWLKTTQTAGNDTDDGLFNGAGIISAFSGPGPTYVNPIVLTGSKLAFYTRGIANESSLHSTASINTGSYVHAVVTRDLGTGEKRIYINGVLDAAEFSTTDVLDDPDALNIGYNNGHGYRGRLDEIQIYSGVLSPAEVDYLFNNPGASVPDTAGDDFNVALNSTNLTWTTGGAAPWFVQTTNTHDSVSAAQSGVIGDDGESWIETTINGPGTLTFWWNVSSEDGADYLEFLIDGNWQNDITGDWGWDAQAYAIGTGAHTLRWRYYKDGSNADLSDAGFLDEVTFTAGQSPMITTHPFNQTNYPGYQAALLADGTGTPSPTWQWYKDGTLIPGATSTLYIPTNSGSAGVAGNYHAVASNSSGSANTTTASVSFVSVPLPADWSAAYRAPIDNSFNQVVTNYGIAGLRDSAGNIYSANSFTGTNTIGATTYMSGPGRFSTVLMKLNPATGNAIWSRAMTNNGNGNSYPQCIAPAPGDGVYLSGVFIGTNGLGTNVLTEVAGASTYLARLASDGTVLWVRTIGGTNFCFQSYHELVADPAGNVTISVLAQDFTSVAGATNVLLNGQRGLLAQFDANGTFRWLSAPSAWCLNLAYHAGRIYATMGSGETNYIGGLTNTSDRHWVLAALDATNGQAVWLRNLGSALGQSTPVDAPYISASGSNIFLVGTGAGSNAMFGAFSVSWPVSVGQYLARYDTNGNAQLATAFGSDTTMLWASVADASGNVYVGGEFDGYSRFGGKLIAAPHLNAIGNGFHSQAFVAKFDRDGSHQWARIAQSPSFASLRDIFLGDNAVWAIGFTDDRARFGGLTVYGPGICLGSPICTLQYLTGGWIGNITESGGGGANPITLLNPQNDGSNFRFSFQSQSGFTHSVLYRTNLAAGSWLTNSSLSGDGTVKNVTLPLAVFGPAKQGFVRVQTQ